MLKFLCWVRVGEGIIRAVDSRQGGLLGIVRLCPSLPSPLGFSNFDIFLKTLFFFYHKLAQIHSNFTILGVLGPPLHGGHKISQKTYVQILMHPTVVGAFSEY